MQKVLVVFEELLNSARLLVLDVGGEQADLLRSFHRRYAGADDIDPVLEKRIIEFFYDGGDFRHESSVVETSLENVAFDLVVVTGMLT